MNKYLSLFSLISKNTFLKTIAVILLVSILQMGIFTFFIQNERYETEANSNDTYYAQDSLSFDSALKRSYTAILGGVAFSLVCAVLFIENLKLRKSTDKNTLKKFSLPPRSGTMLWIIHNIFIFFILWAAQILTMIALYLIYRNVFSITIPDNQILFISFYHVEYLHGLLPLEEISIYIRNVFMILAMAMGLANVSYKINIGKRPIGIFIVAVLIILNFQVIVGDALTTTGFMIFVSLAIIIPTIIELLKGEYYGQ